MITHKESLELTDTAKRIKKKLSGKGKARALIFGIETKICDTRVREKYNELLTLKNESEFEDLIAELFNT